MTAPDFLALLDRPDPRGVALEDSRRSMSYQELATSVQQMAAGLARLGVDLGDRVAVMLPNSVASVEVYLACAMTGAIWVGVNPAAPEAERQRQRALVTPTLTITEQDLPSLAADDTFDAPPPDPSVPCAIGFTSGTTGTPKAFVHSRSAVSLLAAVLAEAQLRADDRIGVVLPMSIHNLIAVGALPALFAQATCVAVERMNARGVAYACRDRKLTMVNALVPATIYDLVHDDEITADMLASLRVAGTGAAGLSEPLRSAFESKFGRRLIGSYGMTEAPGVVCIEDPEVPHAAGSAGKPLPHLAVHACDEHGRRLVVGQQGALTVSAAVSGAWANMYLPAAGTWTPDGFAPRPGAERCLRTGDYGWVDADGAVHVNGRTADVIVRGGVNVNAAELESVLGQLPGVRDVAVVGEDDERLGQRIVAYVETAPGGTVDIAQVRLQAREVLSHSKVPDEFVITRLPRNPMGKVVRGQLKGGS
ncbi:AMP-dependent synthetase [Mycobacterium sp. E342]|uniref:class I adenylate-forming enzyme family protein n=1 Tax=Mycobacterium TaxID=1763 RepID=UPI0007FED88E|nr:MULTISPECIES: class I adenylate-forming enzyme family protein [unclassified Mycobacterium]OBH01620.1 AMP-dependent synthetase [Mycobacterium sp. E3247]OBH31535.1 AMP-dependent synthetase [Mycobacterium sp. E342]